MPLKRYVSVWNPPMSMPQFWAGKLSMCKVDSVPESYKDMYNYDVIPCKNMTRLLESPKYIYSYGALLFWQLLNIFA